LTDPENVALSDWNSARYGLWADDGIDTSTIVAGLEWTAGRMARSKHKGGGWWLARRVLLADIESDKDIENKLTDPLREKFNEKFPAE